MKKPKIGMQKVVCIISVIFMLIINFISYILLFTGQDDGSLIPFSEYILPPIHGIILILTIYLCFKYNYMIQFWIMQIESLICVLAEFQTLGIFLFYSSNFILTMNRYDDKNVKYYFIIPFPFHLAALILNIVNDWARGCVYLFSSVFVLTCFLWFYESIKVKFSCFMPTTVTKKSLLADVKAGSKIYLSDYGLTERQVNFIYDFINNDMNYRDLSEKYFISLSTVKREFTEVYKIFNVTKMEELHILLLQYVVYK